MLIPRLVEPWHRLGSGAAGWIRTVRGTARLFACISTRRLPHFFSLQQTISEPKWYAAGSPGIREAIRQGRLMAAEVSGRWGRPALAGRTCSGCG